MTMGDIKKGDRLYVWHDTVAFGMTQWAGTVVRVNRKTVTMLMDHRDKPTRIYPDMLHRVDWEESQ